MLFRFPVGLLHVAFEQVYLGQFLNTPGSLLTTNGSKVLGRDGVQVPSSWACPVYVAAMLLLGRFVIACTVFDLYSKIKGE